MYTRCRPCRCPRVYCTLLLIGVWVCMVSGCTKLDKYYAIYDHPKISAQDFQPVSPPPSVAVSFTFETDGKLNRAVTTKWLPHVKQTLAETNAFSELNPPGQVSDMRMDIRVNNKLEGVGGAVAQGIGSGLTLGLFGTNVTDDYECETTINRNRADATPFHKTYRYGLTSTSGLIKSEPKDKQGYSTSNEAFGEMIEQLLLKSLLDFQHESRKSPE